MSRAYRISVKENLARHVQVEDGVRSSLELLPILGPERMRALLAGQLTEAGFERVDEVTVRRKEGEGVEVTVKLDTGEVSITADGHLDVNLITERTAVVENVIAADREKAMRTAAQESLEHEAQREEQALRRQVTAKLERRLGELKEELDGVVNRVTGTALKERAAELGQVEAVHEDAAGNLTIKIRV